MDVDEVITKKEQLGELLLKREVMEAYGTLHSVAGNKLMAAISKLSLEIAGATGTMVENYDNEMKTRGSSETASWKHTAGDAAGDEEYPLTMSTFSRVVGTLSQHHDNHLTAHSQIALLEKRVANLESELARLAK